MTYETSDESMSGMLLAAHVRSVMLCLRISDRCDDLPAQLGVQKIVCHMKIVAYSKAFRSSV